MKLQISVFRRGEVFYAAFGLYAHKVDLSKRSVNSTTPLGQGLTALEAIRSLVNNASEKDLARCLYELVSMDEGASHVNFQVLEKIIIDRPTDCGTLRADDYR